MTCGESRRKIPKVWTSRSLLLLLKDGAQIVVASPFMQDSVEMRRSMLPVPGAVPSSMLAAYVGATSCLRNGYRVGAYTLRVKLNLSQHYCRISPRREIDPA